MKKAKRKAKAKRKTAEYSELKAAWDELLARSNMPGKYASCYLATVRCEEIILDVGLEVGGRMTHVERLVISASCAGRLAKSLKQAAAAHKRINAKK